MSFFQSRDGTQLHEQTWPAQGTALASVVIVHGYGEHIARYDETGRALAAAGFSVRGLDLRGHGQSSGVRGYCDRFDQYLEDLDAMIARARGDNLPVYILAHSFGALVAPFYTLAHAGAVAGMVLTSPFWKLALAVPPAKLIAGKIASRVYGKLALPSGLRGADVTRDPEIAAAYDRDPLNNKTATARWFTEASAAQESLVARAAELTLPVLVVAGEADKIAASSQARVVFDRIASKDKTLRMLTGQYHEVLNEPKPDREKTVAEIVEWLRAHASAQKKAAAG